MERNVDFFKSKKNDFIEAMAASGRITVTRDETDKPSLLDPADLEKMKIAELKALMAARGISSANCVEKSDLIRALTRR